MKTEMEIEAEIAGPALRDGLGGIPTNHSSWAGPTRLQTEMGPFNFLVFL